MEFKRFIQASILVFFAILILGDIIHNNSNEKRFFATFKMTASLYSVTQTSSPHLYFSQAAISSAVALR